MTPLVSIVVPCYAASDVQLALLDETLRTVAAQTYTDYEAIVVDDGSPRPLAGIGERYPATRVVRQANAGCAAARNTGIAASRGDLLLFLDSDDHLLPAALEAGVNRLQQHPDAGFVVGQREEMTYEGDPVSWGIPAVPEAAEMYRILLGFEWYIIPPSSAMFRREAVESVGGFQDPWGADDLDFYLRVAWRYRACSHQTPVTRYRRYSASSSRDGERMLRSVRVVYERQRPLVRGDAELEEAYARGLTRLTAIFVDCLVENVADRVRTRQWRRALRSARVLVAEHPSRVPAALRQALRG